MRFYWTVKAGRIIFDEKEVIWNALTALMQKMTRLFYSKGESNEKAIYYGYNGYDNNRLDVECKRS